MSVTRRPKRFLTAEQKYDLWVRILTGQVTQSDAAAEAYVRADPPVAITDLIRDGFAAVSAGLPEPTKREEAHHG